MILQNNRWKVRNDLLPPSLPRRAPPSVSPFFLFLGLFVFQSFCLSLSILIHISSFKIVQILLKSFDLLQIDGAHWLTISITGLEFCNILLQSVQTRWHYRSNTTYKT